MFVPGATTLGVKGGLRGGLWDTEPQLVPPPPHGKSDRRGPYKALKDVSTSPLILLAELRSWERLQSLVVQVLPTSL